MTILYELLNKFETDIKKRIYKKTKPPQIIKMNSLKNFLFIALLIFVSSKGFGQMKQQVLNADTQKIVHEVQGLLKNKAKISKIEVQANIIATNPVIEKAIFIPKNCGPKCEQKPVVVPEVQPVQTPIEEPESPIQNTTTQVVEEPIEVTEPETQVPEEEEKKQQVQIPVVEVPEEEKKQQLTQQPESQIPIQQKKQQQIKQQQPIKQQQSKQQQPIKQQLT